MKFVLSTVLPVAIHAYTKKNNNSKTWPLFANNDLTGQSPNSDYATATGSKKYWKPAITEYAGLRYGHVVFIQQNVTTNCEPTGNGRPFWNTGEVSAQASPLKDLDATNQTAASAKCTAGKFWQVCADVLAEAGDHCYGGLKMYTGTAATEVIIPNRMAVFHDNTKTATDGGNSGLKDGNNGNAVLWTSNQDFLLASMWQKSVGKQLDASMAATQTDIVDPWCSKWFTKLALGGTGQLVGQKGVSTYNKCTWEIQAKDATEGFAFLLQKDSKHAPAAIQYIEWLDETKFGSGTALIAATTGKQNESTYPGYKSGTDGEIFLNPMSDGAKMLLAADSGSTQTWTYQFEEQETGQYHPGSIGFISQFNENGQQMIMDSGHHITATTGIKKAVDAYNALLTDHNKSVTAFNTLAKQYNDDSSSVDLIEVGRAFPKTQMGNMKVPTGPTLDIKIAGDFKTKADYKASPFVMGTATLTQTAQPGTKEALHMYSQKETAASWTFSQKDLKHSANTGWLVNNDSANTKYYANVGHAFGRLGQTSDIDTKSYSYREDTLSKPATMLLSFFPDTGVTEFGSAATDKVTFDVKATAWLTNDDVKYPGAPSEPTSIIQLSAQRIASTVIAAATIASTLF